MSSSDTQATSKPIRAATFRSAEAAQNAVDRLSAAGFTQEQISVVCSDEAAKREFAKYKHEEPAGSHTAEAAATGGAAGAILGGLTTAGLATATGISLLAAGPSFLIGGAVAGSFIGAMQTRGEERELADYYDQALTRGDLLVAVEDFDEDGRQQRLERAEQIFRESGAEPIRLQSEE
ncbi:MAG: hypothetical protein DWQ34_21195 [Planctomycetota bacterium]|nr:MAG: hypothetical protein DWQ34_21195 [Planctomycetota bacterium]REJ96003.1 MAG: hypothetical protein DWQ29_01230 [Planctomycetota bacterium]REK20429.1 MAG: hypothetical protein DWQ41_25170 [Planctomycetota bacterium]REK29278.1 MAG: hypothetical protein DWQ45_23190 [Planctomycetota bacterium]